MIFIGEQLIFSKDFFHIMKKIINKFEENKSLKHSL